MCTQPALSSHNAVNSRGLGPHSSSSATTAADAIINLEKERDLECTKIKRTDAENDDSTSTKRKEPAKEGETATIPQKSDERKIRRVLDWSPPRFPSPLAESMLSTSQPRLYYGPKTNVPKKNQYIAQRWGANGINQACLQRLTRLSFTSIKVE